MRFIRLRFFLKASDTLCFPDNPVNTLRGALGYQLKKLACIQRKGTELESACKNCKAVSRCAYALCYETSPAHISADFSCSISDLPNLMLIDAEFEGRKVFPAGSTFSFVINLFGAAINSAPHLIVAIQKMGKHGLTSAKTPCELEIITDVGTNMRVWTITDDILTLPNTSKLQLSMPNLSQADELEVTLKFITPIAFKSLSQGTVTTYPEFSRIIGSLMRRYTIFEASEGNILSWNFGELSSLAREVKLLSTDATPVYWQRFSTRQKQRIPISGIKGKACYFGPIKPFIELLNAGNLIRCGRSIAFGQGRIAIEKIQVHSTSD